MKIVLIQPRAPWGRHPYLPNGLLSVAARLMTAGVQVVLLDENVGDRLDDIAARRHFIDASFIGISVMGAPYIPQAIRVGERIRECYGMPILIGGEVIMRLAPEQFARIFRTVGDTIQVDSDAALGRVLGLHLPNMYDVSMAPAIEALPEHAKRAYFTKEWCLFTSQGCAFTCNFCAATKGVPERFRNRAAWRDEVRCLARLARRYAGPRPNYEVYCSTLDGCQTPSEMDETLAVTYEECVLAGVRLRLRFLATAKMTVRAVQRDPYVLCRWRDYGLACIGIGVDGDDPVAWKRENKLHNNASVIGDAFRHITAAGIQPEAFMVIGLPGDSQEAIVRGAKACFRFARRGIRPRPYLGKAHTPGAKGWQDGGEIIERFIENPDLLRELDYGGLGSPATHPDHHQRLMANAAFFVTSMALKATSLGCPTQPLLPTESVSFPWRVIGRAWNVWMPQDR